MTGWPDPMVEEWLNAIRNVVQLANELEGTLLAANNLNDVDDAETSRDNLGLTDDNVGRTNLSLGSANDVAFKSLSVTDPFIFAGGFSLPLNSHGFFGNNDELDLYRDAANSRIENKVSGSLHISNRVNDGSIIINARDSGGTDKTMARFGTALRNVELYSNDILSIKTIDGGFECGVWSGSGATKGILYDGLSLFYSADTIASTNVFRFYNSNGAVGQIQVVNSETIYGTTSDKNLKDSHGLLRNAHEIIEKIEIHEYNFKGEKNKTLHGVMAQDCYEVYPNAILTPIEENDVWGADYSKFVPLLIAHNQDLQNQVNSLEERLDKLERAFDA